MHLLLLRKILQALVLFLLAMVLTGCVTSNRKLAEETRPQPAIIPANLKYTEDQTAANKAITGKSALRDYADASLPSQIGYSLQELNKPENENEYPAIADIPAPDYSLMTAEERKKLEEELLLIGQRNQ